VGASNRKFDKSSQNKTLHHPDERENLGTPSALERKHAAPRGEESGFLDENLEVEPDFDEGDKKVNEQQSKNKHGSTLSSNI
jgi:hypothetical protein